MLGLYCICRLAKIPTKFDSGFWYRKVGKQKRNKKEEEADALVQKSK